MSGEDKAGWERFLPQSHAETSAGRFAHAHAGRSVMITGAAGSIGSALAQSLARGGAERLLLLDRSKGGLAALRRQLAAAVVVGDAGDAGLVHSLLRRNRVDIIYHAAAWKHVPLLEDDPFEAVRNNALATHTLAQAAIAAKVPKLVLISTDKAVNPRSIMGVSKRLAELIVVALSAACRMNAIRLCNVIGTSGSVAPLFREQIAGGGPVTVTDRQATRWFLTMSEAVEAILECGTSQHAGKIWLPRVGRPVRIAELAQFLIELAGSGCGVTYVGLRPGEKLTEELVYASEILWGTVADTERLGSEELTALMEELSVRTSRRDLAGMLRAIAPVIPQYVPSDRLLGNAAAMAASA